MRLAVGRVISEFAKVFVHFATTVVCRMVLSAVRAFWFLMRRFGAITREMFPTFHAPWCFIAKLWVWPYSWQRLHYGMILLRSGSVCTVELMTVLMLYV